MRDTDRGPGRPKRNVFGGPLTKGLVRIILLMCNNGLYQAAVKKELGCRNSSVFNQIKTIQIRTGLDVRDLYDAVELYNLVWDEYPELVEEISKERFIGKRVPIKYIP